MALSEGTNESGGGHKKYGKEANIVFCACRSVEDKLQAMTWLLARAEEGDEKEELEQAATYFGLPSGRWYPGKMEAMAGGMGRFKTDEERVRHKIYCREYRIQ